MAALSGLKAYQRMLQSEVLQSHVWTKSRAP